MSSQSKLKKLSAFMSLVCLAIMICLPILVIGFWVNFEDYLPSLSIARSSVLLDPQYIQSHQIVFAALLSMLGALLLMYGLWNLRKLFKLFQGGQYFTLEATQYLRKFGLVLLLSAILKPITSVGLSVILTIGNPPGKKSVVVEFGSNELALLFIAATFFIITWIFHEGTKLATENSEFV